VARGRLEFSAICAAGFFFEADQLLSVFGSVASNELSSQELGFFVAKPSSNGIANMV
jgi:hypothetical protein